MAARSARRAFHRLTASCWVIQSPTYATNSGIFIADGEAILVDPGLSPAELEEIAAFVADREAVVRGVVLTHAHWDHLLGPRRFPEAPTYAHRAYATVAREHGADLQRQVAAWERHVGAVDPEAGAPAFVVPRPIVTFSDRLVLSREGLTLQLMAAPGHAPDQIAVFDPDAGLLWAGDMLSDLEIPMVMGGLTAYRQTLARLATLNVRVLVPGHGNPTTDTDTVRARFDRDQDYLARLQACVEEAAAGTAGLEETVARCASIPLAQPDSYAGAHQRNIEQAYLEMGGIAEGVVGWAKDWVV